MQIPFTYEQAVIAAHGLARQTKKPAFVVTTRLGFYLDGEQPPEGTVWFRVHQDGRVSQ